MHLHTVLSALLIFLIAVVATQDTSVMSDPSPQTANRLIHATSPYLLQHAHNPVDWYEWGEEALARAKKEDKPILVSIGYSSCHWCHVMERESFENEDIAKVMNEFFICIKVDREERPDIDQIYMEAVQALGLNGGWPLNVFLTPEQKPFYGGTYYPPQSWVQLLQNINKAYQTKREQIETTANELTKILSNSDLERFKTAARETALKNDLKAIYDKMSASFDTTWGGMAKAPKFVMPSSWMLMLRHYFLTNNRSTLDQVKTTLDRVAMGGIHDQLAGGFARYSVDGEWFAPHFEKMLYDNAQLMSLYAEAYAVTGDKAYSQVIRSIFDWLQNEMTHPDGGFYSALDADSEGEEGKYYVWKKSELDSLLGEKAPLINAYFSVTDSGNWEHGNNILIRHQSDEQFLSANKVTEDDWAPILSDAKSILLTARSQRIAPGLDDKIITSWNALMIVGLTDAYKVTGEEDYLNAALAGLEFLEKNLRKGNVLFRSFKDKASTTTGFLDDYAFLIHAYLRLYQVTFTETYLGEAQELTNYAIEHFYDEKEGFFFYVSADDDGLITRKKEVFDNVIPSSNSMMARNLFLLGTVVYRPEWKEMARKMIGSVTELTLTEPHYMANWGISLLESKTPLAEVAFIGAQAAEIASRLHEQYLPFALTMGTTTQSSLALLENKEAIDGKTTIYVCFEGICKLPVHSLETAREQILASVKGAE